MIEMKNITITNDTLNIKFDKFSTEEYELFLRSKKLSESIISYDDEKDIYQLSTPARFATLLGIDTKINFSSALSIPDFMFDYEKYIINTALKARRYAIWADCGMGKTLMFLEYARQVSHITGGRLIIFSPNEPMYQTVEEAQKFYGEELQVSIIKKRDDIVPWIKTPGPGVAITNYEKMADDQIPELKWLAGVILDESSILKTGGGKIKWNLIHSCKGIPYKLSCTATPAPNDTMEYASQGSFLEKLRNEGEILWTFFTRDKSGEWKVKQHAKHQFYRFMSGWSIYLRNPVKYGFKDNTATIPAPRIFQYKIPQTQEQISLSAYYTCDGVGQMNMFGGDGKLGIVSRSKLSQIAKGFYYDKDSKPVPVKSLKPQKVADIVTEDALQENLQVLVWTVFDEESQILYDLLKPRLRMAVAMLDGSMSREARIDILEKFRHGQILVLISKARLLGYGMNFQNCGSMVFSGWNDSYEQWYQAIRRAYRYGQKKSVKIHVPYIQELEGIVLDNVLSKRDKFENDVNIMEQNYIEAMREQLRMR